jgi:hypothetical protein
MSTNSYEVCEFSLMTNYRRIKLDVQHSQVNAKYVFKL